MDRFTAWRGTAGVQPQLPGIDAGKDRLAERRSAGTASRPPAEDD